MPPAPASAAQNSQVLPAKEGTLFQQLPRFYDSKQYKKGIKVADQILKKFPNHGETLAMKGLLCHSLKRRDEGLELIKKGVACNIKSAVCWHVYGIIYRTDQKYDDAIKCYQQSLRIQPDDMQILRDLAQLQIHRRYIDGFTETRRKILVAKPTNRINWVAFATGAHLAGDYKKAISIIDSFLKTLKTIDEITFEDSELLLYRNMILEESGNITKALSHIQSIQSRVLDHVYVQEKIAQYYLKLNKVEEAKVAYHQLIQLNPDNSHHHRSWLQSMGISITESLSEEQQSQVLSLYEELSHKFPKSAACRRLPLNYVIGDNFRRLVDQYLQTRLRKGIPSLFTDLKPLYSDSSKTSIIEELLQGYISTLKSSSKFTESQTTVEEPQSLLWTLTYAASHYDQLGKTCKALEYVDAAIAHTPTTIDLYILKGGILKHSGDYQAAYLYVDHARKMDTADRYLNTKCVKYALRADQLTAAESIFSLFLKSENDMKHTIQDLQIIWYECRVAESLMRQGQYNKALAKLLAIQKHFDDINEDQFDFHGYCLRKGTVRAYYQSLKWQENLRSHKYYIKATALLGRLYMKLYYMSKSASIQGGDDTSSMTDEDKKRLEKKLKRQANKAAAAAGASFSNTPVAAASTESKSSDEKKRIPEEIDISTVTAPLEDASCYVSTLKKYCSSHIETHLLACEVYIHKHKWLLVLNSLLNIHKLQPNHPQLIFFTVQFLQGVSLAADINPVVKQVIESVRSQNEFLGNQNQSAQAMVDENKIKFASSLPHSLAAARVSYHLNPKASQDAVTLVSSLDSKKDVSFKTCFDVLDWLTSVVKSSEATDSFKSWCLSRFPHAPQFGAVSKCVVEESEDEKQ